MKLRFHFIIQSSSLSIPTNQSTHSLNIFARKKALVYFDFYVFFNSFTIFTPEVCKVSITFLSFKNYLEIKPLKKFSELKRHAAKAHPGSKLFNLSSSNPHRQCLPCSVLVKVQFKTFETTKNLVCVIFRLKVFAFCYFSLTLIQTL